MVSSIVLIDLVKVFMSHSTHNGHFKNVLPNQSLGLQRKTSGQ